MNENKLQLALLEQRVAKKEKQLNQQIAWLSLGLILVLVLDVIIIMKVIK